MSAKKAALSAHLQMEMKENLEVNAASLKAGKTRTKTDSSNDVYLKMNELLAARVFLLKQAEHMVLLTTLKMYTKE